MNIPTKQDVMDTSNKMAEVWSKLGEQVSAILAEREVIKSLLPDELFPDSKDWASAGLAERVELLKVFYLAKQDQVTELETEHGKMWPNMAKYTL